jgi:crotonobetainyl-CoA:carnitine CoA-transferase CaiB-like acyl-CoA transferase
MTGVLEGIRVLDFGRYIAGPFCGTMLGDLGAEVIRIEKLEGSEDRWFTPVADGGEGAMFLQMGRNKLSLTLNPTKPAGREIVKKLVALSDVVIANLPYEDLQIMGIDYETISAVNPRIILATTSDFRFGGPLRHARGLRHDRPGNVKRHAPVGRRQGADTRQRPVRRFRYGALEHCGRAGSSDRSR